MIDPEVVVPKIQNYQKRLRSTVSRKQKIVIAIIVLILAGFLLSSNLRKASVTGAQTNKSLTTNIDKSFDFQALNNQGKPLLTKIKMKITKSEKTNQVLVKDQTFTAKNNKVFLILNLELKNDAAQPVNILPGDLVRLTFNGDEENKYAPDLHNNLVPVSAISTKIDRLGFVVPEEAKDFKIYIGELEGKKEVLTVNFPS